MKLTRYFWTKVHKQFRSNPSYKQFLCNLSPHFRSAWSDSVTREHIRTLAAAWLPPNTGYAIGYAIGDTNSYCLFTSGYSEDIVPRKVLLDHFLCAMISQARKPSTTITI